MSEIINSVIQFVIGPGLVAALGVLVARTNKRVKSVEEATTKTNEQVSNSHGTNLRDDIDKISRNLTAGFESVDRVLKDHGNRLDNHGKDIRGIRDEISQIRQVQRDQWNAIDVTQPRSGVTGKTRRR